MVFPIENRKIALSRASMVITYYIKLFRTGADRHNGILMSLLLLVAEAIINQGSENWTTQKWGQPKLYSIEKVSQCRSNVFV